MGSENFLGTLMILIITASTWLISSSEGYKFIVGGKRDGWVVNPKESFNHWAERNRFQVNDTLFFRYKKGSDSVLVVKKEDYFSCNTTNPIQSFTDGESEFKFDRSGPFFFISGNADNCNKGQRLIVVVLALRDKHHNPPIPSPLPSPSSPSPPPSSPSTPPPASSPTSESPDAGGSAASSGAVAPAPAPKPKKNLGSLRSELSTLLVVGLSVGVLVVLGSFSIV